MTAGATSHRRNSPSSDERASQRAASAPASLAEQIDRIAHDLAAHRWLTARADALAHGAALAAAQGALALATASLCSPRERNLRRTALDAALPALDRAGLAHVADLVAAALALEQHTITLTHTCSELQ
ncbi:hypothetical protein [Lichenibacterium dinghuense]|uniref:hypothetical protein n=1 Tax=Lichenibacterium dinghuense TaxID=2895977 RepID=UPI001F279FFA|nr:hypothetical protein [Lichenibacterium sp. 6Y81]